MGMYVRIKGRESSKDEQEFDIPHIQIDEDDSDVYVVRVEDIPEDCEVIRFYLDF